MKYSRRVNFAQKARYHKRKTNSSPSVATRMGATGAEVNELLTRNSAGPMPHRLTRKLRTRGDRNRAALKEQY